MSEGTEDPEIAQITEGDGAADEDMPDMDDFQYEIDPNKIHIVRLTNISICWNL